MSAGTLGLIGIGHIGGSIARGLREAGAVDAICGHDTDPGIRALAREIGMVDECHESPEAVVERADLLVLAVPPSAIAPLCLQLQPLLAEGQVVTDVGSVKALVLREVRERLGELPSWFVPGHPIAGTEKQGPRDARGDLFRGRCVVLTPEPVTDRQATDRVRRMWQDLGAQVEVLDADAHDELFAGISHLPHVLSYALIKVLAEHIPVEDMQKYAGGGLLDFTRIASSSPDLWTDICRSNRERIAPLLARYARYIEDLAEDLREDRAEDLRSAFSEARDVRERLRSSGS